MNNVYQKILSDLYHNGLYSSPRALKIKELLNYNFTLNNPLDNIITIPGFETNVDYAEEELRWYYAATNRIDFSDKIQKTWKNYSDDGIHVNSAYGYRIFGGNKQLNQWEWIKNKLKEDPDTRQAVININNVSDKEYPTKDFPCTVYVQLFIRDNQLYWLTNARSSDVVLGIRNDVYCFTKMQQKIALELNVGLGKYYQQCGSLHIYSKYFEKMEKTIKNAKTN